MSIKEKDKYMTDIWTDPQHPAAFTGLEKLYQIIRKEGRFKIGRGTIKKFLEKQMHTVYKNRQEDIFQGVE